MLSAQVFDIFRRPVFDESIQKVETRTYYPFVKSFQPNDVIEIVINQGDAFLLMYDAAIFIKGTLKKTVGNGRVEFINNAGAFFFDSISYELNGKEVDNVRDPGIVSTIRGLLCYSEEDSRRLGTAGWNYPSIAYANKDGEFSMRIPLCHLLSVFDDYKYAVCGKQTIRLVRAQNDNNCMVISPASATDTDTKGALEINTIELKVKHVIPSDGIKLNLLQAIRLDKPIIIPFRKWQFHGLPNLTTGTTREIWAVRTCTDLESPRYVIVAFQTDRKDSPKGNCSQFDHLNISDVRLTLNGEYYPVERARNDFAKNNFTEVHFNYTEFVTSYTNNVQRKPLLDYTAFKTHPMFVIDCSKRATHIKNMTVDVKLDIESTTGFPANTRAYCIIIHDCILEYLPLSEIVRSLS